MHWPRDMSHNPHVKGTTMTIEHILQLETEQVFDYIYEQVRGYYSDVDHKDGHYLVFHGSNKVALVAHVDTLTRKKVELVRKRNVIFNPNDILGADDRAGVYGLIKAAQQAFEKKLPMPTLIFTDQEESGGVGVKTLLQDKILDKDSINLFVEMDRKGCNEYVFYSWSLPKAVKKYVRSFGYNESQGSYSDITDITDDTGIPAVNISCGYYNQHTNNEVLHVDELEMNIDRVVQMLADPIQELHKVESGYFEYDYDWDYPRFANRHYSFDSKGNTITKPSHSKKVVSLSTTKPKTKAANTVYDLEYFKEEIKFGLLQDDYVRAYIFEELTYANDADLLYELEEMFASMAAVNPFEREQVFEEVWTYLMNERDDMILQGEYDGETDDLYNWG